MSATLTDSLNRHRVVLLVCVVLQATLGVVAARAWLARHNTLQANGRWVSTKTTLDRGLMGAFAFVTERNALAAGSLDLGAWHGCNEVIFEELPARPASIAFRAFLFKDAWVIVGFNRKPGEAWDGIRLSTIPYKPSAFVRVSPEGQFLALQPLARPALPKRQLLDARLDFSEDRVTVAVAGLEPESFPLKLLPGRSFGFRGSLPHAYVDDIVVTLEDGRIIEEDFDAPPARRWLTPVVVAGVLALHALLFLVLRRFAGPDDRFLGLRLLVIDLTLLVLAAMLYGFVVRQARWYPKLGGVLQEAEAYFLKGAAENVFAEIEQRFGRPAERGVSRILFIGASQTWGAGAQHADETWVAVSERLLNARAGRTRRYECINGGISAARARDLRAPLIDRWLPLKPDLVVIDLASNDRGTDFTEPMRILVEAILAAGARLVLVKEPNEPWAADRSLQARHLELEALAVEYDLPLLDMQSHLNRQNEAGLLWWDKVHLTTFGQRLFAEKLVSWLEEEGLLEAPAP